MRIFFYDVWKRLVIRLRSAYWRRAFGTCAPDFVSYGKIIVRRPGNVSVGRNVRFDEKVYINARAPVTIGDHVRFSSFVRINTGGLNLDMPPDKRFDHVHSPVHIGNYVWLATGVMVNPGVTIHDGVVVGAGAVVTRDLPANTLCVGVPAKPIRGLPEA